MTNEIHTGLYLSICATLIPGITLEPKFCSMGISLDSCTST